MSLSLFNAVVDARNNVASGFGLEEACRLAAAEHRQDFARVAVLAADALIAQAQACMQLPLARRTRCPDEDDV